MNIDFDVKCSEGKEEKNLRIFFSKKKRILTLIVLSTTINDNDNF